MQLQLGNSHRTPLSRRHSLAGKDRSLQSSRSTYLPQPLDLSCEAYTEGVKCVQLQDTFRAGPWKIMDLPALGNTPKEENIKGLGIKIYYT